MVSSIVEKSHVNWHLLRCSVSLPIDSHHGCLLGGFIHTRLLVVRDRAWLRNKRSLSGHGWTGLGTGSCKDPGRNSLPSFSLCISKPSPVFSLCQQPSTSCMFMVEHGSDSLHLPHGLPLTSLWFKTLREGSSHLLTPGLHRSLSPPGQVCPQAGCPPLVQSGRTRGPTAQSRQCGQQGLCSGQFSLEGGMEVSSVTDVSGIGWCASLGAWPQPPRQVIQRVWVSASLFDSSLGCPLPTPEKGTWALNLSECEYRVTKSCLILWD